MFWVCFRVSGSPRSMCTGLVKGVSSRFQNRQKKQIRTKRFELLGRTGCEAHPSVSVESLSVPAAKSNSQAFSWPSLAAQRSGVALVDGGVHHLKSRRTTRDRCRRVDKIKSPFTLMRIMSECEDAFFIGPVRGKLTKYFGYVSGSQVPEEVGSLEVSRGHPRDSRTVKKVTPSFAYQHIDLFNPQSIIELHNSKPRRCISRL